MQLSRFFKVFADAMHVKYRIPRTQSQPPLRGSSALCLIYGRLVNALLLTIH